MKPFIFFVFSVILLNNINSQTNSIPYFQGKNFILFFDSIGHLIYKLEYKQIPKLPKTISTFGGIDNGIIVNGLRFEVGKNLIGLVSLNWEEYFLKFCKKNKEGNFVFDKNYINTTLKNICHCNSNESIQKCKSGGKGSIEASSGERKNMTKVICSKGYYPCCN